MEDSLFLDAWAIHNRINLYLLDAIGVEHLKSVSASKGRSVGEQFAHLHNVRLMWIEAAAPDLIGEMDKIEKENAGDKKLLRRSLEQSSKAIASLLSRSLETGGKVKGFKPHVGAFLGYLISHESHHRGQMLLALKQSKLPLDRKIQYGLWEWGVR